MSEVNPDPVARLAKFTPASASNAADLLFAAGRASARAHRGWKAAVAALALSNVALGALLLFGSRELPPAAPPLPVAQPQPEPVPAPPASAPAPTDEPWSYRTLRATDPEYPPKAEPFANLAPAREPLTALSGRRGDID